MSFSETYVEARELFRARSQARGGVLEALPVGLDPEHGELTSDVAVFGDADRALVVSSGVHGIEGFAGSAVQSHLLERDLPGDVRVVLVHAVNPYGMACGRRVNGNNVDLNRNCLPPGAAFTGASEGYRALYPVLHPETAHGGFDPFLARVALELMKHGMPALRQAVAGGQYDYPKGLFWGGHERQAEVTSILGALPRWLKGVSRAVLVDFHTGLGRSGSYSLLVSADAGSAEHTRLARAYGSRVQPQDPRHSVAYKVSGAFADAAAQSFEGPMDVLVAEVGTCSAIRVIRAMRAENRAHFWGGDVTGAKRMLRHCFYPPSPRWKEAVLRGGGEILETCIARVRDRST